jgi:hypothetical protein
MAGVLFCFGDAVGLEAGAGGAGLSVARGHRDELHQVERDVFRVPRSCVDADPFLHERRPPSQAEIIAVSRFQSAISAEASSIVSMKRNRDLLANKVQDNRRRELLARFTQLQTHWTVPLLFGPRSVGRPAHLQCGVGWLNAAELQALRAPNPTLGPGEAAYRFDFQINAADSLAGGVIKS